MTLTRRDNRRAAPCAHHELELAKRCPVGTADPCPQVGSHPLLQHQPAAEVDAEHLQRRPVSAVSLFG